MNTSRSVTHIIIHKAFVIKQLLGPYICIFVKQDTKYFYRGNQDVSRYVVNSQT